MAVCPFRLKYSRDDLNEDLISHFLKYKLD